MTDNNKKTQEPHTDLGIEQGFEDNYIDDQLDVKLSEFSRIQRAHLVLREAFLKEREKDFLEALEKEYRDKLKEKTAETLPLFLNNPSVIAEHSGLILQTYPDINAEIQDQIQRVNGRGILEEAGLTDKQIDQINEACPEFLSNLAVTRLHEETFAFPGPSLTDRLKESKQALVNQLQKPNARKALQIAGIAIGCATGGIVISAGLKASSLIAGKVAKTPGFQALMKGMGEKAVKFASKLTGKPEREIREKTENRKNALGRVFKSPYFAIPAAIVVGVAVGSTELAQEIVAGAADQVAGLSEGVTENVVRQAMIDAEIESPGWLDRYAGGLPYDDHFASFKAELGTGNLHAADVMASEVSGSVFDPTGAVHEVKAGDNLWNIAKSHLEMAGADVSNRSILEATQAIYEANSGVIGNNPDFILPGQQITIPESIGGAPAVEVPSTVSPSPDMPQGGLDWGELDFESIVQKMETPGLDGNTASITLDKEPSAKVVKRAWEPDPFDF